MSAYIIGAAYKTLGDYDQAFKWWTRAVERYEAWTLLYLPARNRNDPVIGKDPRFLALLKRMGLEGEGEKKGADQAAELAAAGFPNERAAPYAMSTTRTVYPNELT